MFLFFNEPFFGGTFHVIYIFGVSIGPLKSSPSFGAALPSMASAHVIIIPLLAAGRALRRNFSVLTSESGWRLWCLLYSFSSPPKMIAATECHRPFPSPPRLLEKEKKSKYDTHHSHDRARGIIPNNVK